LRNIVFRFDDPMSVAQTLRRADQELPLPAGETVRDGEWVLAVFDVGGAHRATTAAAARGLRPTTKARAADAAVMLSFERRDWERLLEFGQACGGHVDGLRPSVPPEAPTKPSLSDELVEPTPRPAPASGGARVLLVDDEHDICEVVGAMLEAVGLHVECATSAEEALERIRARSYDLVMLDWNLPGMTGIELCRLMRKDSALLALPVLFLSAHAAPQDVVEAFASGADDYVVKPFRAPELGARIFALLRRARMATQGTAS
jgi:two-component system phosphate regulon response regulator PhoB